MSNTMGILRGTIALGLIVLACGEHEHNENCR